jgi:hypothetical protein
MIQHHGYQIHGTIKRLVIDLMRRIFPDSFGKESCDMANITYVWVVPDKGNIVNDKIPAQAWHVDQKRSHEHYGQAEIISQP